MNPIKNNNSQESRITIKDIANELGLSTATISNVIHGKTKKISNRTVAMVQKKLEESGYIPNMAAVLLAQNSSKIICVVLSNDARYEEHMLEDPFVCCMLNHLSKEISNQDYFMMLKEEADITKISKYASMWNMAGLILMGYSDADYSRLRETMHIPFVVVDAYRDKFLNYSDVGIDNQKGGYLAGEYLLQMGHKDVVYLADANVGCNFDRYMGLCNAMKEQSVKQIPSFYELHPLKKERYLRYESFFLEISNYTAAFLSSDLYALEFMNYLQAKGLRIPEDFSILGFDNIPASSFVYPALTTISQNMTLRATCAIELLLDLIHHRNEGKQILLPVELIIRESVSQRHFA